MTRRRRIKTSPLADDVRRAIAEGTHDAVVRTRRRPPVVHTSLPMGPKLTGDDALEVALTYVPTEPAARAYHRWLELGDTLYLLRDADPAHREGLIRQAQFSLTIIAHDLGEVRRATEGNDV